MRYYKNLVSDSHKGKVYAGNYLDLDTDNELTIPIGEAGTNEYFGSVGVAVYNEDEVTNYTKISDKAFNLAVTTAGSNNSRPATDCLVSALTDDVYFLASFDAVVNSGTAIITNYHTGSLYPMDYTIVNGRNEGVITGGGAATFWLYFDGTNEFDIEVTNFSIKNVLSINPHIISWDATNNVFKQITYPAMSYTFVNQKVGEIAVMTAPFNANDMVLLNKEPELLGKLALGGSTGLSLVTADIVSWYPCMEDAALVYDAKTLDTETITNFDANIREVNVQEGTQTTAFKLNNSGVPIAIAEAKTMNVINDIGYVNTGFIPDLTNYTIREIVKGDLEVLDASGAATGTKTNRTEKRIFIMNDGKATLFINAVRQLYTPPLIPNSEIKLGEKAVIGYPDVIDERIGLFEINKLSYPPININKCLASIGGENGTEYEINGFLVNDCIIFKEI